MVGPVKHFSLEEAPSGVIYLSAWQVPRPNLAIFNNRLIFVVRTTANPLALADTAVKTLRALDPDVPVSARSMRQATAWTIAPRFFNVHVLAFFAGTALLLAGMGLYAIIAQLVIARTREIGIRIALGAERTRIMRQVVGQGLRIIALGVATGLLTSLLAGRLVAHLLYGVRFTDLPTYLVVVGLVAGVALAACVVPSIRASRIDPLVALRTE